MEEVGEKESKARPRYKEPLSVTKIRRNGGKQDESPMPRPSLTSFTSAVAVVLEDLLEDPRLLSRRWQR